MRAIAMTMVIIAHSLKDIFIGKIDLLSELGSNAVYFFFVLSGFLISRGLLKQVDRPTMPTLGRFYAGRFLRLMPAYYTFLLLFAVLLPSLRPELGWHLAYLSNVMFAVKSDADDSWAGHLWSLSVEEQFYLIAPLMIMLSPRRVLPYLVGAMVLLGAIFWSPLDIAPEWATKMAFFDSLDSLGIGVCLALLESRFGSGAKLTRYWPIAAIVMAATMVLIGLGRGEGWPELIFHEAANIVYAAVVWAGFVGFVGFGGWGKLLMHPVAVGIGRISYTMYVVHMLFNGSYWYWAERLHYVPYYYGLHLFAINYAASIVIALASWWLIEGPIDRWRKTRAIDTTATVEIDGTSTPVSV